MEDRTEGSFIPCETFETTSLLLDFGCKFLYCGLDKVL